MHLLKEEKRMKCKLEKVHLGIIIAMCGIVGASVGINISTAGVFYNPMAAVLGVGKDKYDYILIDCMPSLGMITLNALTAADSVIIPVQAQYLPAKGMTQLLATIAKVKKHTNPNLHIDGVLLTLVDGRTNLATVPLNQLKI